MLVVLRSDYKKSIKQKNNIERKMSNLFKKLSIAGTAILLTTLVPSVQAAGSSEKEHVENSLEMDQKKESDALEAKQDKEMAELDKRQDEMSDKMKKERAELKASQKKESNELEMSQKKDMDKLEHKYAK